MIIKNAESGIVKNGLVLWLNPSNDNSYPNSGSRVYDLTGTYSYSENINSPTFDENVFVYNGSNQYTQLPNLSLNFPFHISYWGLERSSDTYGPSIIFSDPTVNSKSMGFQTVINSFGVIRIYNYDGSFNAATTPAVTDTYYHVCGNFTGSSFDLYVNGEYKTSLSGPHSKVWTDTTTSYNVNRLNRPSTIHYGGKMGDIQIYDRVLTAEEIQQNYEASAPKYAIHTPREPDYLVIHDQFSGSGSIVGRTPDTVDNGNTWAWRQYQTETAFTISSGTCYAVSDSTRSHSVIDVGSTAFRAEAVWQSQSVTTDEGRFGLVVDSTNPDNHTRFSFQENILYLQEISGGVFTNTVLASSLGMGASTDYRMVVTIDGDSYDISIVDVSTSSTITSHTGTLASTVNGYVGKWFRRANSATYCSDFKVYI